MERNIYKIEKKLFITSDEIVTEYSQGLYFIDIYTGKPHVFSPIYINKETIAAGKFHTYMNNGNMCKKIIMTTDQDLITEGIQAVEEDFLNWFVKNPSCEFVKVFDDYYYSNNLVVNNYKIIIPKEEPKQECNWSDIEEGCVNDECECERKETLEEAFKLFKEEYPILKSYNLHHLLQVARFGAKWQAKRMYSEEEVKALFKQYQNAFSLHRGIQVLDSEFIEWFEQFKKK